MTDLSTGVMAFGLSTIDPQRKSLLARWNARRNGLKPGITTRVVKPIVVSDGPPKDCCEDHARRLEELEHGVTFLFSVIRFEDGHLGFVTSARVLQQPLHRISLPALRTDRARELEMRGPRDLRLRHAHLLRAAVSEPRP